MRKENEKRIWVKEKYDNAMDGEIRKGTGRRRRDWEEKKWRK